MSSDGTGRVAVASGVTSAAPAWTADGSRILFADRASSQPAELYAVAPVAGAPVLRLTKEVLERLGLALGGEPASRLSVILAMTCSPDTLLRLLRRLPDAPIEPPRVVSLDDWSRAPRVSLWDDHL